MSVGLDLAQIVLVDLSLAADNALVVGMVVAALPGRKRVHAMFWGIGAATVLRILMAFFAVQLLALTGLMVAGGLLLAWVGWKMLRDMHLLETKEQAPRHSPTEKLMTAVWKIVIADISMSLDNVLGVAGIARDHRDELVIGLALSVVLMGTASGHIARLVARYPKLGYIGVAIVFYTAMGMIYEGGKQTLPFIRALV